MEARQVRWSWLGELDRRHKNRPPPPVDRSMMPGYRQLSPLPHSARELFTVGRRFSLARQYGKRHRLVGPWQVTHHNTLTCGIQAETADSRIRCLAWRVLEEDLLQDRVRWLPSAPPRPPSP